MNHKTNYKNWFDGLPEEKKDRFHSIYRLAWYHSLDRTAELVHKSYIRSDVSAKNDQTIGREELMRATDELTRIEFPCDWNWIRSELEESRQKIRKVKGSGNNNLVQRYFYNEMSLLMGLLTGAGLLNEYLNTEVGSLPEDLSEYNTGGLKDFDRIVEFMGRFGWVVLLMSMVEFGNYGIPIGREVRKLSFRDLFRPEYRDTIPGEVLRLLGPGEAKAWAWNQNEKMWVYPGPKNSITVPFFILRDMGFISIPPRGLKDYISAWLGEFGVEYRYRTFDKPSKGDANSHFEEYLIKLQKGK